MYSSTTRSREDITVPYIKPGNHLSDRLGPQAVQQYACKSRYWSSSFCRASGPHQHIGVVYNPLYGPMMGQQFTVNTERTQSRGYHWYCRQFIASYWRTTMFLHLALLITDIGRATSLPYPHQSETLSGSCPMVCVHNFASP